MKKLSLFSILNEATARRGPRTGAFEFDQGDIDNIIDKIRSKFADDDAGKENSENEYFALKIRNPISGQKESVYFYFDDERGIAGWAFREGRTIGFNPDMIKNASDEELRSTIEHELTHVFEREKQKSKYDKDSGLEKYYLHNWEIRAFIQQIIQDMIRIVKNNPDITEPEFALMRSPSWKQVRKYYEKNPELYKRILRAAYDVVQEYGHKEPENPKAPLPLPTPNRKFVFQNPVVVGVYDEQEKKYVPLFIANSEAQAIRRAKSLMHHFTSDMEFVISYKDQKIPIGVRGTKESKPQP